MNKEEALVKLKNKLSSLNKETVEAIETLIPEIAETEDEKIRKEIINFLISTKDVPNDQIETIDKWIDWLGHPGEGKTKTDAIKAAAEKVTKDKNKTIAFLKEAGIMDKNGRLAEMYRIEDPDAYCKENCKGYQECGKCYADGRCCAYIEAQKLVRVLKMLTIPDDIKTEWTAEDNVMMSRIVGYLKQDSNEFPERSKRIGEMIEWIKNLCGKHTWTQDNVENIAGLCNHILDGDYGELIEKE